MPWEISIGPDSWQELRDTLEKEWSREQLICAITDDTFERVEAMAGQTHATRAAAAERLRLAELPQDLLADRAFELIEQTNTCDNGGFAFWIDREGYHRVHLP